MEAKIKGPQGALNLATDEAGGNVSIVFAHSDAGTLHHWDGVRADLASQFATAALDRRGHGKSEFPANGSFAPSDGAGDIEAAANAAGFDRFVLVGHSGGALVAMCYAHFSPDRVI